MPTGSSGSRARTASSSRSPAWCSPWARSAGSSCARSYREAFLSLDVAIGWAVVNVSPVDYGDDVPTAGIARVVGGPVMIFAMAFVAIRTVLPTSSLVARGDARGRRWKWRRGSERPIASLARIKERLERTARLPAPRLARAPASAPRTAFSHSPASDGHVRAALPPRRARRRGSPPSSPRSPPSRQDRGPRPRRGHPRALRTAPRA